MMSNRANKHRTDTSSRLQPFKRALFLDRDGIINEDDGFIFLPQQVRFIEPTLQLCRYAQSLGYLLVVVTNQSGVARGYFKERDVVALHHWMKQELAQRDVHIADFLYCPYHPQALIDGYRVDSPCRKPAPGMIFEAAARHSISLKDSFMLGDKPSDRIVLDELRSYVVKSGYCQQDYDFETVDGLRTVL